jgi:hypothetical protein
MLIMFLIFVVGPLALVLMFLATGTRSSGWPPQPPNWRPPGGGGGGMHEVNRDSIRGQGASVGLKVDDP